MPKQFCFIQNFVRVRTEMIWESWPNGNEIFIRLGLYSYS